MSRRVMSPARFSARVGPDKGKPPACVLNEAGLAARREADDPRSSADRRQFINQMLWARQLSPRCLNGLNGARWR